MGKIRLALTPWQNHCWHVALLTTSPIPYQASSFQIDFDFIDHLLWRSNERWRVPAEHAGPGESNREQRHARIKLHQVLLGLSAPAMLLLRNLLQDV